VVDPAVLQKALVDGVKRQLHQMLKHLFRQHCVCFTFGTEIAIYHPVNCFKNHYTGMVILF
jgi:hypothetical protein